MRRTLLGTAVAVTLTGQAWADVVQVDLNPSDPKYNTPQCVAMRQKAQNFEGIFQQSAGSYAIAAVMPGGTAGLTATWLRKREMFIYEVEKACLSNPPKKRHLDADSTLQKD